MADNFIRREVTITVSGKTASLSEPIYLYPRDRYIDIFFTIKDAGFKFGSSQSYGDNASYARIKYIRKDNSCYTHKEIFIKYLTSTNIIKCS